MLLLLLALPRPIQAAPPGPPAGCDPAQPALCALALKLGDPAPFAGQLLSTDLALRLGQNSELCDARLRAAVLRCQKDCQIDHDRDLAAARADKEAFATQLADVQASLDRAEKLLEDSQPPFFAQPWFVAPLTAIVTAGVVVWAFHH